MSPKDLTSHLWEFVSEPVADLGRPKTAHERVRKHREKKKTAREENIAILDTETDPFDNKSSDKIRPFVAVLYSDKFETIVIWEEHFPMFCDKLVKAIEDLPGKFTIYAHNGGKFDFMFLIHKLRGEVSFKGRGIMKAKIGNHELRDSLHLIPEKLASYHKEEFDYTWLVKSKRKQHKQAIIDYCISDCAYLLDLVKKFIGEFGLKLSIGQAATIKLKEHYEIEKFSDAWDAYIRQFFFGGRVECLQGAGEFIGDYKNYDVNSMYPHVMAECRHPIGGASSYELRVGEPNENTVFIDLDCTNHRALICRGEDGATTALKPSGNFQTTIWEYEMALKYGLIENVKINWCVDCSKRTDFSLFVKPLYAKRVETKTQLDNLKRAGTINAMFYEIKKDDLFYKLILNNAYGKQAQNPRRFKEHYITDPDETPPESWFKSLEKFDPETANSYRLPAEECDGYWIWSKPCPSFHFNNVGCAASITGAARAVLMEAIHLAKDPIYCDTDSLICRELTGVPIHKTELGAWDIEDEFSKVAIAGKKLYAGWHAKPKIGADGQKAEYKLRSKGTQGLVYRDIIRAIEGESIETVQKGVTITRNGHQEYIKRKIRSTAPKRSN